MRVDPIRKWELHPIHVDTRAMTLESYERCLPHWRRDGSTYFVTFRLADSIPRAILENWRHERRTWLAAHGLAAGLSPDEWRKRYEAIPEAVRREFGRQAAGRCLQELDKCHGECVLRNPEMSRIVADTLRFHDGTRLRCGDFVVMPNHVHWLLTPLADNALERILQSVKRFSANQINRRFHRQGSLWRKESYDHIVRDDKELERTRAYIVNNPAGARLKPNEFIYYRAET